MKHVTPLLTQVRTAYFTVDCGMSYIMRLNDGRFVIIDSNWGEYDEPEHLLAILDQQNTTDTVPTIAAWFFTHAHPDHYLGFVQLCERLANRFRVEQILYHFPFEGRCPGSGTPQSFANAVASRKEATVITPHTGDIYTYADTAFEVLYTWEDQGDAPIPNINDSSLVMRMKHGKYTVMWLGDAQKQASDLITSRYSPDQLKCDLLQVGHHGYGGGSDALYRAIDPEIVLWPCPDFWHPVISKTAANAYLIHSEHIRATFVGGRTEAVLDMSVPIEPPTLYFPGNIEADFTPRSMCALHWSCLTGGSTGYTAAKLIFPEEGGCRLVGKNARTLCQMIQPGQTATTDRYTFYLCGTYDHEAILQEGEDATDLARIFGLMWNDPTPMTWAEDQVFPLPAEVGKPFAYRLTVDRTAGKATLYEGKTCIAVWEDLCGEPCGIHLILKNTSVTLTQVRYEG